AGAHHLGRRVEQRDDLETARRVPRVVRQGVPEVADADDGEAVLGLQAQGDGDVRGERLDVVPDAPRAARAPVAHGLAHLRRTVAAGTVPSLSSTTCCSPPPDHCVAGVRTHCLDDHARSRARRAPSTRQKPCWTPSTSTTGTYSPYRSRSPGSLSMSTSRHD